MKKMLARYPLGNSRHKWKQDNFILSLVEPGPMGLEHGGPTDCEKARHGIQTAKDAGKIDLMADEVDPKRYAMRTVFSLEDLPFIPAPDPRPAYCGRSDLGGLRTRSEYGYPG